MSRTWLEDAEWRRTWDRSPGFTHYVTYVTPSPTTAAPNQTSAALHFLSYPSVDVSPETLPAPVRQLQGAQDKDT